MRTITAYYVDPTTNTAEARDITTELDTYYELLHCDTIDIVSREIGRYGKRRYEIICDDNGLFVDDVRISAIDDYGQPMLVGALLVTGEADDEGELTTLDEDDIKFLTQNTEHIPTWTHPEGWRMLCHVDY